jgi:arginyl-tRNA synthetase
MEVGQACRPKSWFDHIPPVHTTIDHAPDGTSIYIVRDIAGARQRHKTYAPDKMIYVIGDQQDMHVAQFFKILGLMDMPFAGTLEHVNFGKIHGMSTRKGEVKFLQDILDLAKEAMLEQMGKNPEKLALIEDPEETADQIGMTCVKIQDMQAKRYAPPPGLAQLADS